jgi:hypothetical protein
LRLLEFRRDLTGFGTQLRLEGRELRYQKGESRYPVICLLHGALDTYKARTEDPEWANIPRIMDKLIASD